MYPEDLKYTSEHEWVRSPGEGEGTVRVGITHFAQDLLEEGGVLRPKAITAGVAVEVSTGGAGPFATMTYGGGETYALSWPTALPKPVVKDGVATFANAAGQGADLVVTVLPTGFRHDVMLRERPTGPVELRAALLERPDQFVQTLTEKLMTYGLGRGLEHTDMPTVRRVVRDAAENDYRFSDIVWGIVNSTQFRMKGGA